MTCSDLDGDIYDPDGIDREKLDGHHGAQERSVAVSRNMLRNMVLSMLRVLSLGLRRQTSPAPPHQLRERDQRGGC